MHYQPRLGRRFAIRSASVTRLAFMRELILQPTTAGKRSMTTARYSHPPGPQIVRDIGLIGTRDRKLAVQYVLKERLLVIAVRGHLCISCGVER